MAEEERAGLRHMITSTMDRLQKSSIGANNMGTRYSRLLQLLWRKTPKKHNTTNNPSSSLEPGQPRSHSQQIANGNNTQFGTATTQPPPFENTSPYATDMTMPSLGDNEFGVGPSGTFSWLDLGAAWSFATQNNTVSVISGGSSNDLDLNSGDGRRSSFDIGLLADYSLLNENNPNLIF